MALIEGGRRSADVVADQQLVVYAFALERIHALSTERPAILATILANIVRSLNERLRRANEEIRSLD